MESIAFDADRGRHEAGGLVHYVRMLGLLMLLATAPMAGCTATRSWPSPADSPAHELLSEVTVEPLATSLSTDAEAVSSQLWDLFANRGLAKRFSEILVPDGADAWPVFRDRLLEAARTRRFNAVSLEAALAMIEAEEGVPARLKQLLPYAAFLGRQDGREVWIIPCVWEEGVAYDADHRARPVRLGHIRVWVYTTDTTEKTGFVTCK